MSRTIVLGIVLGVLVSGVAWVTDRQSTEPGVSVLPDIFTLVVLIAGALGAFAGPLEREKGFRLFAAALLLGFSSGMVLGASTALRGIARWADPRWDMVAIAFPLAVVTSILITAGTAGIVSILRRAMHGAGA